MRVCIKIRCSFLALNIKFVRRKGHLILRHPCDDDDADDDDDGDDEIFEFSMMMIMVMVMMRKMFIIRQIQMMVKMCMDGNDGWMDGWVEGRTDGQTEGMIDGWVDGWMDG